MAKHSVCLFCSAVEDLPAAARGLAAEFGAACAARGLRLVYGGSGRGLMGIAARAAAAAGGGVVRIMPPPLLPPPRAPGNTRTPLVGAPPPQRHPPQTQAPPPFLARPPWVGAPHPV